MELFFFNKIALEFSSFLNFSMHFCHVTMALICVIVRRRSRVLETFAKQLVKLETCSVRAVDFFFMDIVNYVSDQ